MDAHTTHILAFADVCDLVARCAATALGRDNAYALTPCTSREQAVQQGRETRECMTLLSTGHTPPFGGCVPLTTLLSDCHTRRAPFSPEDLLAIASTAETAQALVTFFHTHRDSAPQLATFARDMPECKKLREHINSVIHHDATIKDSASPTLASLRARERSLYTAIQHSMRRIALSPDVRGALEDTTPRMRNGRPVLAVKSTARSHIHGTLIDASNSGATFFIEPHSVTPRVNEYETVLTDIRREENMLLWQCTEDVIENAPALSSICDCIAHLDLVSALARFAHAFRLVIPILTEEGVLHLPQARHPLLLAQYMAPDAYVTTPLPENAFTAVVPLTLSLNKEHTQIVVTGPNTGGKTVALKTIGLCVLMAHAGMPIPTASEATIPWRDAVMVDIGDEQSLAQSLSTFSAHMKNCAQILHTATPQSLVLLDELGAGTDPDEGAALATALLDYLHQKQVPAVITTHLSSLKLFAYATPGIANASMSFDADTLKPTYHFLVGQPGSSHALTIAHACGIPDDVIEETSRIRARHPDDVRHLIMQLEEAKRNADAARENAHALHQSLQKKWDDAEENAQRVTRDIHAELAHTIADIRTVIDDYLHTAKNAPAPWGDYARELVARLNTIADGTPLAQQQKAFHDTMACGDSVYVSSFATYGVITALQKKQRVAHVCINELVYRVPYDMIVERPFDHPDTRAAARTLSLPEKSSTATDGSIVTQQPDAKTAPPSSRFIKELKTGDVVYVPSFHTTAPVTDIHPGRKKITVTINGLPVSLSTQDIRRPRT